MTLIAVVICNIIILKEEDPVEFVKIARPIASFSQ
jgi:hypothetical protein